MKKSSFTDSQIIATLKRVEAGLPVPEICLELGMSTATLYKWRVKFGGMDTSMMVRMKELEDESRRLKKMYLKEQLKAEIANEYLAKNNPADSPARDGQRSCAIARAGHTGGLCVVLDQRVLLPIRAQA